MNDGSPGKRKKKVWWIDELREHIQMVGNGKSRAPLDRSSKIHSEIENFLVTTFQQQIPNSLTLSLSIPSTPIISFFFFFFNHFIHSYKRRLISNIICNYKFFILLLPQYYFFKNLLFFSKIIFCLLNFTNKVLLLLLFLNIKYYIKNITTKYYCRKFWIVNNLYTYGFVSFLMEKDGRLHLT